MAEMTRVEIADLAEQAAEGTLKRLLLMIGIDVNDPLKAQKDFAVMREVGTLVMDPEFRKDLEHTRRWRKTFESITTKGIMTAVGILVAGAIGALWVGFKFYVSSLTPGGH